MSCYFLLSSYHNTKLQQSDTYSRWKFKIFCEVIKSSFFCCFLHTAPYKKETKRLGKIVRVLLRTASCKPSIAHNILLDAGVITKRARYNKCAMHNIRVTDSCTRHVSYTVHRILLTRRGQIKMQVTMWSCPTVGHLVFYFSLRLPASLLGFVSLTSIVVLMVLFLVILI